MSPPLNHTLHNIILMQTRERPWRGHWYRYTLLVQVYFKENVQRAIFGKE